MSSDLVQVTAEGALGRIHLNRPEALNSLNLDMIRAIAGALDRFEAEESVRAIALTGEGRALCAGGDIKMIWRIGRTEPESALQFWAEYGTDPHYITVDDSQREGRTATRINRLAKDGVLVINGQPVGMTVFHPGAQAYPFMRPALDMREADAVAAAQTYINSRVSRSGILGDDDGDSE